MRKDTKRNGESRFVRYQKAQSKQARLTALRWLAENFPDAFDTKERIRPLKHGILKDVIEHADDAATSGISKSKLREALALFTRRLDYLASLKTSTTRIDLQGTPVGTVTAEEAEAAEEKIKRSVIKRAKAARHDVQPTNRKNSSFSKPPAYPSSQPSYNSNQSYTDSHTYIQDANKPPSKIVRVMEKPRRTYDADAVLRLKERLGLARKEKSDN